MSATLSSNVSTGKAGGYTPVWLLEVDSNTTTYRWSTFATVSFPSGFSGPSFGAGRLLRKGFGTCSRGIDLSLGGNAGDVGGFSFQIANGDDYYNTLVAAGEIFEGRRVELRLIFADVAGASWANALPVFNGYVDHVEFDYGSVKFVCNGSWLTRHRTLPEWDINASEFGDEIPFDNDGQPVPFWYGDFTLGLGKNKSGVPSNLSPGGSEIVHRDYAPCYLSKLFREITGATSLNDVHVIACGHDTHTFPLTLQDLDKFVFDTDRRVWVKIAARFSGDEAFGATFPGVTTQAAFAAGRYRTVGIVPVVDAVLTSAGTTSPGFAVDDDDSNYTTIDANAEVASYGIPSGMGHDNPSGAQLYLKYWIDAVSRVNDKVQVQVRKDGAVIYAYTDAAAYGSLQSIDLSALSTWDGNFDGVDVQFKYVDVTGHDAGCKFRIRSVYFVTYDTTDMPADALYDTGKGRMFGAWIDGVDHSNALSSGDLIENPVYVAESLLCESPLGLGLTVRQTGAALQFNDNAIGMPYMQVAHAAELAITTAITIEFWVKLVSASAAEHDLLHKINIAVTKAAPYRVSFTTARKIRYYVGNGTTESYLESSTLSYGAWYHVVCKSDGSGLGSGMMIYINGVYDNGQSVVQAVADAGQPLRINLGPTGATTGGGAIYDEIRIWNVSLNDGQIGRLYNGGNGYPLPYLPENCVAWWRFDEELRAQTDGGTPGGAFTIIDSSGNGNTASSNNHANMRYVTGSSCHVNYTDSEVFEYGGVTADQGFDNVASLRSTWKAAIHSARERKNSRDWLKQLAQEFGFAYYQRFDGRECVSRIDSSGALTTLDRGDMLLSSGKPTFRYWQGKLSDMKNDFVFRYKKNYASGEYEKTLYVRQPDKSTYDASYTNLASDGSTYWGLCHTAYSNYNVVNFIEVKCDFIRDDTTAEFALKFLIEWLTRRPHYCSWKAPLSLIDLELCDARLIDHPILPASLDSNDWRLTNIVTDPNTNTLDLTWMDVGSSSIIPA